MRAGVKHGELFAWIRTNLLGRRQSLVRWAYYTVPVEWEAVLARLGNSRIVQARNLTQLVCVLLFKIRARFQSSAS